MQTPQKAGFRKQGVFLFLREFVAALNGPYDTCETRHFPGFRIMVRTVVVQRASRVVTAHREVCFRELSQVHVPNSVYPRGLHIGGSVELFEHSAGRDVPRMLVALRGIEGIGPGVGVGDVAGHHQGLEVAFGAGEVLFREHSVNLRVKVLVAGCKDCQSCDYIYYPFHLRR